MRGGGRIALVAAMLLVVWLPATAKADDTPWTIGAAKVDTTPARFDSAQDLIDLPEVDTARGMTCPRAVYDGPRPWRFEEPYVDTDGSGDFNYPDNGSGARTPEPFCDYNHNGRWEGIYESGGTDHHAHACTVAPDPVCPNRIAGYDGPAHDPIDARAVALTGSNGQTVVVESVVAQGIFENYLRETRTLAESLAGQGSHATTCGHIDEMIISSTHNESSPDTIGLYGAPDDPTGSLALNSGIDEYYMDWLDEQMADAAVEACDNREPASLREVDFPVPTKPGCSMDCLEQEVPNRFPTTKDDGSRAAIDPKVRALQARDASGGPIFTMMNLADHNQDIGQSDTFEESHTLSQDWPGYFHTRLEQDVGGMAMFLVADNGSIEDLISDPRIPGPPCNLGGNGCYPQVELTGNTIADRVAAALADAKPVAPGAVSGQRNTFCAPIENNLFKAAAEAGLFGERKGYAEVNGVCVEPPAPRFGDNVQTTVAVLNVGPDLQFISNPGEAFPALMLGGPWGIEDASCPANANPPAPVWHAYAKYRFQPGLGDDLIGYMKPAWGFLYGADLDNPEPIFNPTPDCNGDTRHTHHGLEGEAVGPIAANMVAQNSAALLDANPDPTAEFRLGRYVKADGSLTDAYVGPTYSGAPGHFPTDAVAIWLAAPGETTLNATPGQPDSGTIVSLDSIGSFGSRAVDATGKFMDYDGAEQSGSDINTRGMQVQADNGAGTVQKRYYVNVYPALSVTGSLGPSSPPAADLAVTQSDTPDPVAVGEVLTYSLGVRNNGPQSAHSVSLTDLLPKNVRLRSARSDLGRCAQRRTRRIVCNLANLASGESATVTIQVRPTKAGSITNTATVGAAGPADPVLVNNAASETTTVG
jgi:uncharacterized repeat protein (TIGR01451 family)